jgi:hypothetical protein
MTGICSLTPIGGFALYDVAVLYMIVYNEF